MRCNFIYCVLLLAIVALALADTGCSNGYSSFGTNKCYKVYSTLSSRDSAAAKCNADGGNLASIHDGFTNSYIYSLASDAQAPFIWLGFKCSGGSANNCVNDDGVQYGPYKNFYPGNPNSISECVYMSARSPATQLWFLFDCTEPFGFVCETPYGQVASVRTSRLPISTQSTKKPTMKQTTKTATSTTTTDTPTTTTTIIKGTPHCNIDGYQLFENKCYKFVNANLTSNFSDATAQCQKVPNGNLASIPNRETNDFLRGLVNGGDFEVWIGLTCPNVQVNGDASSCVWNDGTPFIFNGFAKYYPTVYGHMCVNFDVGQWMNSMTDCDQGNNFFCQAPPVECLQCLLCKGNAYYFNKF